jgi:hypothetical protein
MNNQDKISNSIIMEYNKNAKEKLFNEAKIANTQSPLFHINGTMMTLEESVRYLKLYVESLNRKERLESTECPTCRSTVL